MMGRTILLRGLPGSGKTTTAALVRDVVAPSVRVSNDSVRYMAQPRDFPDHSIGASERACLDLAASYADSGFVAVVDGVFADIALLEAERERFRRRGLELVVVTLCASVEDLLERNRARDELARMSESRIRSLHAEFVASGIELEITDKQPEEVASDVLDLVEALPTPAPQAARGVQVLMLRHGAPDYPESVYPDHLSMGLSPQGRAEALAAQVAVARFAPDVVYASDFRRAWETAALAVGTLDVATHRVEALRERSFQRFAGLPLTDVRALLGDEADRVLTGNSDLWEHPEDEPLAVARERVLEFVDGLRERHAGRRVLVVGHGGPHAWLLEKALGADLTGVRRLHWDTGHLSLFDIDDRGVTARYINRSPRDVAHSERNTRENPS